MRFFGLFISNVARFVNPVTQKTQLKQFKTETNRIRKSILREGNMRIFIVRRYQMRQYLVTSIFIFFFHGFSRADKQL